MASLKDKIENALNESCTVFLGVEVLVGFEYSAYFQPVFAQLPEHARLLRGFGSTSSLKAKTAHKYFK